MAGLFDHFARQAAEADKMFALVGRCLTTFRSIEDDLRQVFRACLGPSVRTANAIFATGKTVDAKLRLVDAAIAPRDDVTEMWRSIRKRVKDAADERNRVAHCFAERELLFEEDDPDAEYKEVRMTEVRFYRIEKDGRTYFDEEVLRQKLEEFQSLQNSLSHLLMALYER